jgi:hypothetical protein
MRGRLQNFAKAAILATARENCSIDRRTGGFGLTIRLFDGDKRQRDGALMAPHQQIFVNICDDCITLFNGTINSCLLIVTNLNKNSG